MTPWSEIEDLWELTQCRGAASFERESVTRVARLCRCAAVFVEYSPTEIRVVAEPSGLEATINGLIPPLRDLITKERFVRHFYNHPERFPFPITHAELQDNLAFWNSATYTEFFRHLDRARYCSNFVLRQRGEKINGYVLLRSTRQRSRTKGFSESELDAQRVIRARLSQTASSMSMGNEISSGASAVFDRIRTLTVRQKEVVACLINGKTVSDTSLQLQISEKTVSNHRTSILKLIFDGERAEISDRTLVEGSRGVAVGMGRAESEELRWLARDHLDQFVDAIGQAAGLLDPKLLERARRVMP